MDRIFEQLSTVVGWVIIAAACYLGLRPGGAVNVRLGEWVDAKRVAVTARENWDEITGTSMRVGADNVPVSFVEFLDYKCVYCRVFHEQVEAFLAEDTLRAVAIRFHILRNDPGSRLAALAAVCSAELGKFDEVHRFFLTDSVWVGEALPNLSRVAAVTELQDSLRWMECIESDRPRASIAQDSAWVTRLGVRGTPAILDIAGTVHRGITPLATIELR